MSLSHVFLLFCLCVISFQLNFRLDISNPSGLTLKAYIDDSPSSPLYGIENMTGTERMERFMNVTNARAKYFGLVLNSDSTIVPDNIAIPMLREGLYYYVGFKLGSQKRVLKLLLDTCGGLIWTQKHVLAVVNSGLPIRRTPGSGVPAHVRRELNTAIIGLGDDGGYGGGWVPVDALKKVLRGILKYLGVLWLYAQLPELLKEILGSILKDNEGALLNLEEEKK